MTFLRVMIWIFLIPYILGKFLIRKEENDILYSWVLGYVIEMAVYLFMAIPMIVNRVRFDVLLKYYNITIYTLTILSMIICRKKLIPKKKEKSKVTFFQVVAILLIVLQVFIKFKYANVNNDDSSFVVLGAQMIVSGEMYYEGPDSPLNIRRALAPISAFFATLSQNLGIHVTIVMHTIEPMIFMVIGGIVFYQLGRVLFKGNKEAPYIFVSFFILSYTYFFTTKGAGLYFLQFTWFGRALIGAIFFPLLWKTLLEISDNHDTFQNWLTVLLIVSASCLCSEMAIALVSTSIAVIAFINVIRNRKVLYVIKSMICIIPCIILGVLYLVLS